MSVYQVEEYYIFMSIKYATNTQLKEINKYLESESISNYEHQDGNIVIDGFESKNEAETCEQAINCILSN